MPIEARQLVDPDNGYAEELTLRRAGKQGLRTYRVNTGRADLAVAAEGLPARGDPWSAEHPDLVVAEVGPAVRIGGVDGGDGSGAYSRVPVRYETPTASSFRPASPDDAYTDIGLAGSSLTLYYPLQRLLRDAPGSEGNPAEPTWGGDGASVSVTTISASVHTFWDSQSPLPIVAWLALCSPMHALNHATLRFPRIFGAGPGFTVSRGQARYTGFERPERIEGTSLVRVVHRLELAEHHLTEWRQEDSRGNAVGPVFQDRFYEYANLHTLWPGS